MTETDLKRIARDIKTRTSSEADTRRLLRFAEVALPVIQAAQTLLDAEMREPERGAYNELMLALTTYNRKEAA